MAARARIKSGKVAGMSHARRGVKMISRTSGRLVGVFWEGGWWTEGGPACSSAGDYEGRCLESRVRGWSFCRVCGWCGRRLWLIACREIASRALAVRGRVVQLLSSFKIGEREGMTLGVELLQRDEVGQGCRFALTSEHLSHKRLFRASRMVAKTPT